MKTDAAVIRLVTRCNSEEEFIARFARFTTETHVVVPALPHATVGTDGQFIICLKDESVMMRGRCEVTEIRPVAVAPGAAPGPLLMHLRLRELDAHSCGIHLRLMERHAAPAPDATAVAVVADARSPSNAGAGSGSAPPAGQGSSSTTFTLPANPLSELDATELASFIELTLLETAGTAAAPESARQEVTDRVAAPEPGLGRNRSRAPGARLENRLAHARRVSRRAAPYASCLVVGVLLGAVCKPASKAPPVVSAPSPAPAAPTAAVAPEGEPETSRDCVARVTTTPAGATVYWGDIALGSSPIEHASIPCGTGTVTLRHERYSDVRRTISTDPGQSAVVAERLHRPPAQVVVTSSPPHALITMNKRPFGQTPRKIDALRFERVRLEASLPGYRPWRKTVYLKEAESRFAVTLVPLSNPKARRGSPVPLTRSTAASVGATGPLAAR